VFHDVKLATFSLEPMLCRSAEQLPEGREWRYELKLDGFGSARSWGFLPIAPKRTISNTCEAKTRVFAPCSFPI
jgi:hypothetical protein